MEESKPYYKLSAEGDTGNGFVILTVSLMIIGCLMLIFTRKLIFVSLGLVGFYFIYRHLKYNTVKYVSFYENNMKGETILRHIYEIEYKNIIYIKYRRNSYKSNPLYVIKYRNNNKVKSISFACDVNNEEEVVSFLKQKGINKILE